MDYINEDDSRRAFISDIKKCLEIQFKYQCQHSAAIRGRKHKRMNYLNKKRYLKAG